MKTLPTLLLLCAAAPLAQATVIVQSAWALGETGSFTGTPAAPGSFLDSLATDAANHLNNSAGTVVNTDSPSGVAGSTAYASTSGNNYQGIWMFGSANGGFSAQSIPTQNWGFQIMVRSTGTLATGEFRQVVGFKDSSTGGLAIEALNVGGTVYWQVNRTGQANLIDPRNASVAVSANTWTNLALVKNGANLEFYVDRTLVGSSTGAYATDGLLALGMQQGAGTHNFKGDFDEARLFTFNPGEFNAATDLAATYAAIPEPSAYGLTGACALAGAALARRRRKTGATE